MVRAKRLGFIGLLALPVIIGALGCGNGGSTSGGSTSACGGLGSTGFQGTVDLAVGDDSSSLVALYLDILSATDNNGVTGSVPPAPDITLDTAGSGIVDPQALAMAGDDLYVGNGTNLLIFRGYATATDGAAPDVTLDATGDIDTTTDLLIDADDNLVVADDDIAVDANDEVLIFAGASAIAADVAPDVTLDNTTSLIADPIALAVAGGDLYVGNGLNVAGNPQVAIFRDIGGLTNAQAPTVRLNEDTSFFDIGTSAAQVMVTEADVLFVGVNLDEAYVFNDASTLASDALPDAVLFGAVTHLDTASAFVDLPNLNTVLAGNRNVFSQVGASAPPIVAFFGADALETGNPSDVQLSTEATGMGNAFVMQTAGGALFAAGARSTLLQIPNDIYIFRNVESQGLCDTSLPNIVIPASFVGGDDFGGFETVALFNGMAVNEVDSGT